MNVPRRKLALSLIPAILVLALVASFALPELPVNASGKGAGKPRAEWRKTGAHSQTAPPLGSPDSLFAPDSVWNAPVALRPALDVTSPSRISALASLIESKARLPQALGGGLPNLAADTFSTPIYRVPKGTPRVSVRLPAGRKGATLRKLLASGVPIPSGATPAAGSDGHMTVYQRSSDTLWEFWRAHLTATGWQASWAGVMRDVSNNAGYYDSSAWKRLKFPEGWNWGSTASSLPVAGGTVTLRELRKGAIDHALALALPNVCRGVFAWPAQRTDGTASGSGCIPEGAHLRLNPRLDLSSMPMHPVARELAAAAQTYGMIVRDRTRVSASFFLESPPAGLPSPYTGAGGLFLGTAPSRVLLGFPWRSLQLLPMRLCRTAPCRR